MRGTKNPKELLWNPRRSCCIPRLPTTEQGPKAAAQPGVFLSPLKIPQSSLRQLWGWCRPTEGSIRSETNYVVTYALDSNFIWVRQEEPGVVAPPCLDSVKSLSKSTLRIWLFDHLKCKPPGCL